MLCPQMLQNSNATGLVFGKLRHVQRSTQVYLQGTMTVRALDRERVAPVWTPPDDASYVEAARRHPAYLGMRIDLFVFVIRCGAHASCALCRLPAHARFETAWIDSRMV